MKPKTGRILVILAAVLTPQEQTAPAAECVFAFLQKGNAA